jgi:outer membrane biosynthesis protein TonB
MSSGLLHAALLGLVLVTQQRRVEPALPLPAFVGGEGQMVPVRLVETSVWAGVKSPSASVSNEVLSPSPAVRPRPQARRPPARRVRRQPATEPAPAEAPPRFESSLPLATDAGEGIDSAAPEAALSPDTSSVAEPPAFQGDAREGRARDLDPPYVPSTFARGLRVYEYFPRIPAALAIRGRQYVTVVDICVSADGSVKEVSVREGGAAPALEPLLLKAIHTWRYRPWSFEGVAIPFCHPLRIVYSVE